MAHKYLLPLSACCHQGYLSRISELVQNLLSGNHSQKLSMEYVISNRRHRNLCISYIAILYPVCVRDMQFRYPLKVSLTVTCCGPPASSSWPHDDAGGLASGPRLTSLAPS